MAIFDFGLTTDQFWELTPGQLWALGKRFEYAIERQEFGAGLITAAICNVNRPSNSPAMKPEDFMPSKAKRSRQNPQQMLELVKMLQPILGGTLTSGR